MEVACTYVYPVRGASSRQVSSQKVILTGPEVNSVDCSFVADVLSSILL